MMAPPPLPLMGPLALIAGSAEPTSPNWTCLWLADLVVTVVRKHGGTGWQCCPAGSNGRLIQAGLLLPMVELQGLLLEGYHVACCVHAWPDGTIRVDC